MTEVSEKISSRRVTVNYRSLRRFGMHLLTFWRWVTRRFSRRIFGLYAVRWPRLAKLFPTLRQCLRVSIPELRLKAPLRSKMGYSPLGFQAQRFLIPVFPA